MLAGKPTRNAFLGGDRLEISSSTIIFSLLHSIFSAFAASIAGSTVGQWKLFLVIFKIVIVRTFVADTILIALVTVSRTRLAFTLTILELSLITLASPVGLLIIFVHIIFLDTLICRFTRFTRKRTKIALNLAHVISLISIHIISIFTGSTSSIGIAVCAKCS